MATRFGGVSPAQAYQTKMKWIVSGSLVTVICVLGLIIFFLSKSEQPQAVTNAGMQQSNQALASNTFQASPTVDILVSVKRVEEGAMLEDHMFRAQPWDAETLPEGAILHRDIATIRGKFAKSMVSANLPMLRTDITDTRPISALNIPPGYRAVTIDVSLRSGVEGFAKPNTRVDVLWSYIGPDRERKIATIVRFTKILSVGGVTHTEQGRAAIQGNNTTTVTLLVTEKDAKKIELARTLGTLSLSLVGDKEPEGLTQDGPDEMDMTDLIGRPKEEVREELPNDGAMFTTDPKTGKQVRYVLRNGRWQQDKEY